MLSPLAEGAQRAAEAARCHHREMFRDRADAGRQLGAYLRDRVEGPTWVLGVARGGVVVAAGVAEALDAPLDVVLPRKLGAPRNPELAIGAVASGVRVVDDSMVRRLGVPPEYLERAVAAAEAEIDRRARAYRDDAPVPDLHGTTAIVVDDGVATGATAIASLRWARARGADRVVFATPVGPRETALRLAGECDDVVFLRQPPRFSAVGEWYERFDQVSDDEVRDALRGSRS
jgi:putative phosphoribosyl transferase